MTDLHEMRDDLMKEGGKRIRRAHETYDGMSAGDELEI